jgi:hypothetical protein
LGGTNVGTKPAGINLHNEAPHFLLVLRGYQEDNVRITLNYQEEFDHGAVHLLMSPLFRIVGSDIDATAGIGAIHFLQTASARDSLSTLARLMELQKRAVFLSFGNAEIVVVQPAGASLATPRSLESRVKTWIETWHIDQGKIAEVIPPSNGSGTLGRPLDFTPLEPHFPADAGYLSREVHSVLVHRRDGERSCIRHDESPAQAYIDLLASRIERREPRAAYAELWKFSDSHRASVSQRYSGTPPILHSPCPVGGFELLGLGKAVRAIKRFGQFIFDRIDKSEFQRRLAQRLAEPETVACELCFPNSLQSAASAELSQSYRKLKKVLAFDDVKPSSRVPSENAPLVHYFTGSHDFRFDGTSIVIPLQVLSNGSTVQWSPMSLTHEYCHAISESIISAIQANWAKNEFAQLKDSFKEVDALSREDSPRSRTLRGDSSLDIFSKSLIWAYLQYVEDPTPEAFSEHIYASDLRNENEVITSLFDLDYFYRGDVLRHLTYYWAHWLSVPGLLDSVDSLVKYLARSCCVVAGHYLNLHPKKAAPSSLHTVDLLAAVRDALSKSALKQNEKMQELIRQSKSKEVVTLTDRVYRAHLPLVCVAKAVFFSEKCAEILWQGAKEDLRKGMSAWRNELRLEYGLLRRDLNPLDLMNPDLDASSPDEAQSNWMFHLVDIIAE